VCHQKFVNMEGPSGYKRGGRIPDGHSETQREREREREYYLGSDRCPLPLPKIWSLPCPAMPCRGLSGQVAFKVTYVGVSYESSAIIKESHSACLPDSPCPLSTRGHYYQTPRLPAAFKALCGLMVFSWLLLANTYLYILTYIPSSFPAAAVAAPPPDPCHLSE
jgi:hypothetical protein